MGWFTKFSIGVDIADRSIEVVALSRKRGKTELVSKGRVELSLGIVERGEIKNTELLKNAFLRACNTASPEPIYPKKIIVALPDSHVYLHVFETSPYGNQEELAAVQRETESAVPIEKSDLVFAYQKIALHRQKERILVIATSKKFVEEWKHFFESIGTEVILFDTETLGTFRGLFGKKAKDPVCVIDIGSRSTMISIFDDMGLRYVNSFPVAGEAITSEIARALKISVKEAEEKKRMFGLLEVESKSFPAILKVLERILQEVREGISYTEKQMGVRVERAVLVGGTARMGGLLNFFNENLKARVRIGESMISRSKNSVRTDPNLQFIESIGVALRAWVLDDPAIQVAEEKNFPFSARAARFSVFGNIFGKLRFPPVALFFRRLVGFMKGAAVRVPWRNKFFLFFAAVVLVLIFGGVWLQERSPRSLDTGGMPPAAQKFEVTVPVAVASSALAPARVSGRVAEDVAIKTGTYEEAVNRSRASVGVTKQEHELLLDMPVAVTSVGNADAVTLQFQWLFLDAPSMEQVIDGAIERSNKTHVSYAIQDIRPERARATSNPNIYELDVLATVQADAPMDFDGKETVGNNGQHWKIEIAETETGWLNVRGGPGTTFPVLTKVYPGEQYTVLEDTIDWLKIKVSDIQEGWIYRAYANDIPER